MNSSAPGTDLDPDAFEIHRMTVREKIEIAYVREGVGGVPLLLMSGWPGTKRIYYRNIAPLAAAGFEVVVPDNRGWGDSPVPAEKSEYADAANVARDIHALMEQLGHERWVIAGYDFGSMASQDMALRFPEQIIRQVVWNGFSPHIPEAYAAAGITGGQFEEVLEISDHMAIHADPDALVASMPTEPQRRDFIRGFYQGRVWRAGGPVSPLARPGAFDAAAARLRASLSFYEVSAHPELLSEAPRLFEPNNVTETMILYGIEDKVVGPKIVDRAQIAYGRLVGPFIIPGGGHFLSWEQPKIFNSALVCFCRDLLAQSKR